MGGVLSYSGLSTKIRAMQSRLTTMEQFEEILQLSDVTQVAAYLKRMPEYSSRWDALDENTLHRGQIEKLLKKSIFQNFSRIYHFANPEQRKFLDLYSKRYEIRVLKEVMTNIFDHRDTDPVDVSPYREFFRLHSNIDVDRITTCSTMEELISCLKGNEFYIPLSKILAGRTTGSYKHLCKYTISKLTTTSSTGGLLLALQRAIVTARPKGRYRKHFCWPAIKRYYSNLLVSILLLALLYTFELLHLLYCQSFQHNIL